MNNVEKLVEFFFKTIQRNPGKQWTRRITEIVTELIEEGISASAIEDAIIQDSGHFQKYAKEHKNKVVVGNILKDNKFYYHPILQIAPPPPVITVNPDGSFSKKQQEFFLKMRNCFTFDNALEYFYMRFPNIDRSQKRDVGALEYIYNKVITPALDNLKDQDLNAIDLLLFTIDSASSLSHDEDTKLTKLLNLTDYVSYGILVYQDKREGCLLAGINRVV